MSQPDPRRARALVDEIAATFANAGDSEAAAGMAAYMRDQFEFFGIKSPRRRELQQEVLASRDDPDEALLAAVVDKCWARPQREFQYFAGEYTRDHIDGCSAAFLVTARRAITERSWRYTVDLWATDVVGPLVARHPSLAAEMDDWIGDDDFWVARSALLHQLRYRSETDADRLFRFCLRRAADREFFIRKAIGWALREYSKVAPEAVAGFVREHEDELSGLSRREALKRIAERLRSG